MRRRVIYQSLAWVPIAAGAATLAFATTSHQVINQTVIYEDRTSYTPPVVAETITVDKWYNPLATPVRRKQITAEEGSNFASPPKPEANDQVAWHKPLQEPHKLKKLPTAGQVGYTFVAAAPGAATVQNWFHQLNEPLRLKRVHPRLEFGYTSFQPVAAETVTVDKWYAALDIPVRERRRIVDQQEFAAAPAPAAGDATIAFTTTSGMVFNKTILFEESAYAPFTPTAETVTVDKWWRQLDTPTRRKLITEGAYRSSPPRPEANDAIGWHRPFDEPLRLKRLPTGDQVGYTFVAAAPGSAVVQNWFHQLDTPTRARKLNELPFCACPVYFVPPTPGSGFEYNWWQQLDEPIRPRRSIRTAAQLGYTYPPRLLTTTLEWWQQLTTPTRRPKTFVQYPGTAQGNLNPVVPFVFRQLDIPQRRLRVVYDVPIAPYLQIELVTIDKWWRELNRPTRRIKPVPQQIGYTFVAAAPGRGVAYNWFDKLDVPPIRFKRSLPAGLQQYLSYYPLLISEQLDPACRVIVSLGDEIIDASPRDASITSQGDAGLTVSELDSTITPDEANNIVTVKC